MTTAALTIAPSDINPQSRTVTRHDTRLGTICRDICNGRIQYGAWSMSPDHRPSCVGRNRSSRVAGHGIEQYMLRPRSGDGSGRGRCHAVGYSSAVWQMQVHKFG